jgi:hypothetical protein
VDRHIRSLVFAIMDARKGECPGRVPVIVNYGNVEGVVHGDVAALLKGIRGTLLRQQKIIQISPRGDIIIAPGARSAAEVTYALQQVTNFLVENNFIKLSAPLEYMRVSNERSDLPWEQLKDSVPVCERNTLRSLGLPYDMVHVVGYRVKNGEMHLVFGERRESTFGEKKKSAAEPRKNNKYDPLAAGAAAAHFSNYEAARDELIGEADVDPGTLPGKKPEFLGIVHTASSHDLRFHQRRIMVFGLQLPENMELTPTREVKSFPEISLTQFLDDMSQPDWKTKYSYYTPISVAYFLAGMLAPGLDKLEGKFTVVDRGEPILVDPKEVAGQLRDIAHRLERPVELINPKGGGCINSHHIAQALRTAAHLQHR